MKRMYVLPVLLLSLITLSGCASIIARTATTFEGEVEYSGIYPGLRFDYDFFFNEDVDTMKKMAATCHKRTKGELAFRAIFDLPPTIVYDTVALPFDIIHWLLQEIVATADDED